MAPGNDDVDSLCLYELQLLLLKAGWSSEMEKIDPCLKKTPKPYPHQPDPTLFLEYILNRILGRVRSSVTLYISDRVGYNESPIQPNPFTLLIRT